MKIDSLCFPPQSISLEKLDNWSMGNFRTCILLLQIAQCEIYDIVFAPRHVISGEFGELVSDQRCEVEERNRGHLILLPVIANAVKQSVHRIGITTLPLVARNDEARL